MRDHQLGWHLPCLPLGPAIKPREIQIDPTYEEWCDFERNWWPTKEGLHLNTVDCRQIKTKWVGPIGIPNDPPSTRPVVSGAQWDSLMAAVTGALARHDKQWVKDTFADFGIERARDCPAERCDELIASLQELPSEWIEWLGGECPVDPDVVVEFKLRAALGSLPDGSCRPHRAGSLRWTNTGECSDIVAYRIEEPR